MTHSLESLRLYSADSSAIAGGAHLESLWGCALELLRETISAASWSLKLDGKWQGRVAVPVIDFLARLVFDGPDHCKRAYEWQINLYR